MKKVWLKSLVSSVVVWQLGEALWRIRPVFADGMAPLFSMLFSVLVGDLVFVQGASPKNLPPLKLAGLTIAVSVAIVCLNTLITFLFLSVTRRLDF